MNEICAILEKEGLNTVVEVEHWDENATPFKKVLWLHASTYQTNKVFDIPAAEPWSLSNNYLLSPRKNFAYQNRLLPAEYPLLNQAGNRKGVVFWDGEIEIPTLIDMNRASGSGEYYHELVPEQYRATWGAVWKSTTPNEIFTQRSGIKAASGTVVVGGFGLGWFVKKVCEKETVEKVIVVEKSQELLDWFGYDLCKKQEKVCDVICDDVYTQIGKHGNAMYLLDIWPIFQGARLDPKYHAAKRRLKKRLWAWGIN